MATSDNRVLEIEEQLFNLGSRRLGHHMVEALGVWHTSVQDVLSRIAEDSTKRAEAAKSMAATFSAEAPPQPPRLDGVPEHTQNDVWRIIGAMVGLWEPPTGIHDLPPNFREACIRFIDGNGQGVSQDAIMSESRITEYGGGLAILGLTVALNFGFYTFIDVSIEYSSQVMSEAGSVYFANGCIALNFCAALAGGLAAARSFWGLNELLVTICGATLAVCAVVVALVGVILDVSALVLVACVLFAMGNGTTVATVATVTDRIVEGRAGASQIFWVMVQVGSAVALFSFGNWWTASSPTLYATLLSILVIFLLAIILTARYNLIPSSVDFSNSSKADEGEEEEEEEENNEESLGQAVLRSWLLFLPVVPFYAVFFMIFSLFSETFAQTKFRKPLTPLSVVAVNPITEIVILVGFRVGLYLYTRFQKPSVPPSHQETHQEALLSLNTDTQPPLQDKRDRRDALRSSAAGLAFAVASCIWGASLEAVIQRHGPSSISSVWAVVPYILVSFAEVLFTTNVLRFAALLHKTRPVLRESVLFFQIGLGALLLNLITYLTSFIHHNAQVDQYTASAVVIFLSGATFLYFASKHI